METIISLIGAGVLLSGFIGIGLWTVFRSKSNSKSIDRQKRKEEKINELEKKSDDTIVNDLDNADAVRSKLGEINTGRNTILHKLGSILQRFGHKGIDSRHLPGVHDRDRQSDSDSQTESDGSCTDSGNTSNGRSRIAKRRKSRFAKRKRKTLDRDNSNGNIRTNSADNSNSEIKKIYQTNPRLNKDMQLTGCSELACSRVSIEYTRKAATVNKINKWHKLFKKERWWNGKISKFVPVIEVDGTVTNFERAISFFLVMQKANAHAVHVGDQSKYLSRIPMSKRRTDATLIIYSTPHQQFGGEHYTKGDSEGIETYDPADGAVHLIRKKGFLRFRIDRKS